MGQAASTETQLPNQSWHEVAQARRRKPRLFSLRGRLLLEFSAVMFAVLGVLGWQLRQRAALDDIQTRSTLARTAANATASAIAPAVVRGDFEAIDHLIQSLVADPFIEKVAFNDVHGKTIAQSSTAQTANAATFGTFQLPVVQGDIRLGTLDVRFDPDPSQVTQASILIGVAVSAATLGLTAVLLTWRYNRSFFKPVKQLVASAQRIAAGELDEASTITDDGSVDELPRTYNALVAWMRQREALLRSSHRDAAAAIAELQTKLDSQMAQLENANTRLSGEIEEKEEFLRAVSHDLNAPLRNIGGMVSMLMLKNKDQLNPDVVHRLERIQKNVEVETDLINELLELSRIKTRRQSLSVVDTEALIWELRGLFENDLKTRGIELVIESSLPALYFERARLRQVFQNLIDNAIKYMGEGHVREIRIGCSVSVTEAEFYVRDTGIGIHPDDLDKVFCVFKRGRGEQSLKVPGKGVGLSSVKSIVQTYSGRITVSSKLGEGTEFRFTINGKYVPTVSGQVPEELDTSAATSMPALARAGGSGLAAA